MTVSGTHKLAMIRARELARQIDAAYVRMCGGIRKLFGGLLKQAWAEVKARVEHIELTPDQARDALNMLRNKDRWSDADYAEADRLARIAATSVAADRAADFAEKRELIASAKGRFCSVEFMKADGSERTMQVQPATLAKRIKGNAATDAGKRAVISRKARHPRLLPVWDVKAQAPRSINLATVKTITVDGMAHAYPS
ncbi:MAG: hypothetical protein AAFN63_01645 [Pseudomonadota bacterium]